MRGASLAAADPSLHRHRLGKCTEAFGHCATSTGQKFEPKPQLRNLPLIIFEDADISAQKYTLAYTPPDLAVPNRKVK